MPSNYKVLSFYFLLLAIWITLTAICHELLSPETAPHDILGLLGRSRRTYSVSAVKGNSSGGSWIAGSFEDSGHAGLPEEQVTDVQITIEYESVSASRRKHLQVGEMTALANAVRKTPVYFLSHGGVGVFSLTPSNGTKRAVRKGHEPRRLCLS